MTDIDCHWIVTRDPSGGNSSGQMLADVVISGTRAFSLETVTYPGVLIVQTDLSV